MRLSKGGMHVKLQLVFSLSKPNQPTNVLNYHKRKHETVPPWDLPYKAQNDNSISDYRI